MIILKDHASLVDKPLNNSILEILLLKSTEVIDRLESPGWFFYIIQINSVTYDISIITDRKSKYAEAIQRHLIEKGKIKHIQNLMLNTLAAVDGKNATSVLELMMEYIGEDVDVTHAEEPPQISYYDQDWLQMKESYDWS